MSTEESHLCSLEVRATDQRWIRSPVYNARKEFRANDHRPWKGDVTLVVRVDGIEHFLADSGKQDIRFGVIGFAAINVFIDPASGEAASKEASEFALNTGAFQLMLHRRGMPELSRTAAEQLAAYQAKAGAAPAQQSGDPEAPLYSLITRHPHRTCSSLLLRIVSAPYALNGKVLSMAEASSAGTEQQTSGQCLVLACLRDSFKGQASLHTHILVTLYCRWHGICA